MFDLLLVGCGGFVGSVLRYAVSLGIAHMHPNGFPFATLIVNVLGGFLIGFFSSLFGQSNKHLSLLLTTGLCGGFTTFSTFGLETVRLFENGSHSLALLNVICSLFLCIIGILLGRICAGILKQS
ncbi:protein CrcB [[Clostridium] methylpentosum DSM 5476]|jgi:fluoride exporter|uniref:Fluoride-specific ion channel FluC n=1 Tax=[Clostridium] methylpentosum DSM 5476 TaxID=537013 RepID=C0EDP9_9FIRM|nr:protein CrcB [[Clostridium] methylpentosum DSM 5476]MDY3989187.1 fluoride efflux transporter CrcB [Massilioclostridium sp.]MEE1492630.1 fluoride efflux transporter CrcB [Massilioclostridium sp.]